jgi:hypothetical protein
MKPVKELEIHHIIPYIPFKLEAEMLMYKNDYVGKKYDIVTGINQWDKSGELWSLSTVGGSKPSIKDIKPLLKPLEDLLDSSILLKCYFKSNSEIINRVETNTLPYHMSIILIKNKYDIFNLIDSGLAHNIKTYTKNGG